MATSVKVMIALVVLSVVVLVQFVIMPWVSFGRDRDIRLVGTGRSVAYDFDSGALFHSNNSRFYYFITRDSIRYMASNSDVAVWHVPFSFVRPWMSARGDIVAVGEERGGRVIYVFNSVGLMYRVVFEDPVLTFSVNESGILTAIVQYDWGYGVYAFNRTLNTTSNALFRWFVPTDYGLFWPTHAEVSADGRYIAIAIVDLNTHVQTIVEFRYVNIWDAWGTEDGLFAKEAFQEQLVMDMRFMSDNRLIVAATSQIRCFQMGPGSQIRDVWNIELENVLTHIDFYNDTHLIYVTGERQLMTTEEGDPMGTVRIRTIHNNVPTAEFSLGRRATHLSVGHGSIIVGAERSFHAMDFRGNHLWEHISLFDTRSITFLDNTDTVIIAGANRAEVFQRRRVSEEEMRELFQ